MKDERLQILIDQTIKQKLKFFALVDKLIEIFETNDVNFDDLK